MNENLSWQQIHELLNTMTQKIETQETITRTISRTNYNELLSVLTNRTSFKYDKKLHLKLNIQDGVISITLKRKR